jgi:hypothetical protein
MDPTGFLSNLVSHDEADSVTRSSLSQAIQSFEDALRSLEVLGKPAVYRETEKPIQPPLKTVFRVSPKMHFIPPVSPIGPGLAIPFVPPEST